MALRLVVASLDYHGIGCKATCCGRKVLDGQAILEVAGVPRYAGDDRYRYLHADCVETKLDGAPRSTSDADRDAPGYERTRQRGHDHPRRRRPAAVRPRR